MAERRMFSKTIIDSDAFLDMPLSTQALYFHLSMRADDDGFLNNANRIIRAIGANPNDMDMLLVKKFIIKFDDGICVIKHWRIHNYIQTDRYRETNYKDKKTILNVDENKTYTFEDTGKKLIGNKIINTLDTKCIQSVSNDATECVQLINKVDTQVRLGKDRLELGKDSIDNTSNDVSSTKVRPNMCKDVIGYLNFKANKSYKTTSKETQRLIKARQKEGYVLEDFMKVIDNKSMEWLKNVQMNQYLRPKTLFGTKFEGYLNQKCINEVCESNKPITKFDNFKAREYDYDSLEKKLLGWDKEETDESNNK